MYRENLPKSFPWSIDVVDSTAACIVEMLIGKYPVASSFAVTADAPAGKRRIWLSNLSMDRVQKMGLQLDPPSVS